MQDLKGFQRFLGMCNYLSRFTPNLAEINGEAAHWADPREYSMVMVLSAWQSFQDSQSSIAKFLDVNKPRVLQVDASVRGIAGALLQDGQPVAFTSSILSAADVNYAPLKTNKLARTKFYKYHYGKQNVVVHSDHRLLEKIFKKTPQVKLQGALKVWWL